VVELKLTTLEKAIEEAMADPNTPSLEEVQTNFEHYQNEIKEMLESLGPFPRPKPIHRSAISKNRKSNTSLIFKVKCAKNIDEDISLDIDFNPRPLDKISSNTYAQMLAQ